MKSTGLNEQKQRKKGDLQRIVLQEIEEKGIQSPSTLNKILNPKSKNDFNTEEKIKVKIPNSIYKAFNSLSSSKQNKIEKILEEDGDQGTSTIFYGFTESYLKKRVNEPNCTSEDLWKIAMKTFVGDYRYYYKTAKKPKPKKEKIKLYDFPKDKIPRKLQYIIEKQPRIPNIIIDEMFDVYEKRIGASRDHFNHFVTTETIDIVKKIYENQKDFCDKIKPILEDIALGNEIKFIHKSDKVFDPKTDNTYQIKNKQYSSKLILSMNNQGILFIVKNNFVLSIFGLILLMMLLFDEHNSRCKNNQMTKNIETQFSKQIDTIIEINKDLLPLVFKKWKILKKILGGFDVLSCFLIPYLIDMKEIFGRPVRTPELQLLRSQYDMEYYIQKKLEEEYEIGAKIIFEWAKEKECLPYIFDNEAHPTIIITRLGTFSNIYKKLSKNKILDGLDEDIENIEKSMEHEKEMTDMNIENMIITNQLYNTISKQEKNKPKLTHLENIIEGEDKLRQIKQERYPIKNLSREEYIPTYLKQLIPNSRASDIIFQHWDPIRKFAELYELVGNPDPFSFFGKSDILDFNEKEKLKPVQNIISLYFYAFLKMMIDDQNKWGDFLNNTKNDDVKGWWIEWIDTIDEFNKNRLSKL